MSFLLTPENENLIIKPKENPNFCQDEFYFTSKDLIELKDEIDKYYRKSDKPMDINTLVKMFNKKFECNKILDLFSRLLQEGIRITPKLAFLPTTEVVRVTNGIFYISKRPYNMNGFYFLNNLVLIKYEDGTYDFYNDVEVDVETLKCDLKVNVNGTGYVSYLYLVDTVE